MVKRSKTVVFWSSQINKAMRKLLCLSSSRRWCTPGCEIGSCCGWENGLEEGPQQLPIQPAPVHWAIMGLSPHNGTNMHAKELLWGSFGSTRGLEWRGSICCFWTLPVQQASLDPLLKAFHFPTVHVGSVVRWEAHYVDLSQFFFRYLVHWSEQLINTEGQSRVTSLDIYK